MFTSSQAGVVLISPDLAETPGQVDARIVVDKPQEALLSLLPRFHRVAAGAAWRSPDGGHRARRRRSGATSRSARTRCSATACGSATRSSIGAHCVIGAGVQIGDGCHLYPVGHGVQRLASSGTA